MKIKNCIYASFLVVLFVNFCFPQVRLQTELSDGWKFNKGKNEDAYLKNYDDSKWMEVTVPHAELQEGVQCWGRAVADGDARHLQRAE